MLNRRICVLAAAVITLVAAPSANFAQQNAETAPKAPDSVLTINGESFKQAQLQKLIYDWYTPMGIEELIMIRVVDQEARKAGVKVTDAEVKEKMDELALRAVPPGMDFESYLARSSGRTVEYAKIMIKMGLQADKVLRMQNKVTAADFENYRKASHLLVRVQKTGDEAQDEAKDKEAREKIDNIAKEIAGGTAFEKAVETYSEDPMTKVRGGDLSWFTRGRMLPEFERAVYSLKVGEVSEPVKTTYGYHIIKLTGIGSEAQGEEKEELEETILKERVDVRKWIAELRQNAKLGGVLAPKEVEMPAMGRVPQGQPRVVRPSDASQEVAPGPEDMPPAPPGDAE